MGHCWADLMVSSHGLHVARLGDVKCAHYLRVLGPGWTDKAMPEARPEERQGQNWEEAPSSFASYLKRVVRMEWGSESPKHMAGEEIGVISKPCVRNGQLSVQWVSDVGSCLNRLSCTEGSTLIHPSHRHIYGKGIVPGTVGKTKMNKAGSVPCSSFHNSSVARKLWQRLQVQGKRIAVLPGLVTHFSIPPHGSLSWVYSGH